MSDDDPKPTNVIEFDFIKSPQFRTAHVDGVIGGPTPDGRKIYMSLFSERAPIPTHTTHEIAIAADSQHVSLGAEIKERRVSRMAIVRELEVGVVLDIASAVLLHQWLGEKLKLVADHEGLAAKERTEKLTGGPEEPKN